MEYALITVASIVCLLFGAMLYHMNKTDKKILNQINLIARAVRSNISQTSSVSKKIDMLKEAEDQAADFHRKTAEHHRVLLASLNQQVRKLEALYEAPPEPVQRVNRSTFAPGHLKTAEPEPVRASAEVRAPAHRSASRGTGVVRLEEMFQNRTAAVVEDTPDVNLEFVRRALRGDTSSTMNARRVSNG